MTYADEVLADSPVAYYQLDETSGSTMVDSSGNGRDGSYPVAPTLGAAPIVAGSAFSADFAGSSFGKVPYGSWMDSAAFSAEAWIKPDAVSSYRCVMGRDASSPRSFNVYVRDGLLWVDIPVYSSFWGTTPIEVGGEYQIVLTHDGDTSAQLYVNGVLDAAVTLNSYNHLATVPFYVGATPAGVGDVYFPFDGLIDDVSYYVHELSAARVAAHYDAGLYATPAGYDASLIVAGWVNLLPLVPPPPPLETLSLGGLELLPLQVVAPIVNSPGELVIDCDGDVIYDPPVTSHPHLVRAPLQRVHVTRDQP